MLPRHQGARSAACHHRNTALAMGSGELPVLATPPWRL